MEQSFLCVDKDEVVAFCILSDLGMQDNLKIGGPGCVGTIPKYREKGIGLEMVRRATVLLKKEKYDISWIHYTHIENWYKKLGYETVLKWNSDGIVMEKQHEE
jgi:predicted N-acetyltransferase YhbS